MRKWIPRKNGWFVLPTTQVVEHRCKNCALVTFRREYEVLKCWRQRPGKAPEVQTRFIKGAGSVPLKIKHPCTCVDPRKGPSDRVLKLMVRGHQPNTMNKED